jgi:mono/diheme cytochrome c family protein
MTHSSDDRARKPDARKWFEPARATIYCHMANHSRGIAFARALIVIALGGFVMSGADAPKAESAITRGSSADGLAAWDSVYSVLTSPRCIDCHTATNYPQQGDERRRHFANVIRGPEGKGVVGLNCVSCHQKENADATGVPGARGWHLAPLSMRWQDVSDVKLSSAAVCRALTDRARNHGLDGPGLLKHHKEEPLVLWAWNPGRRPDGTARSVPPLTHAQFVGSTRSWVTAGSPCPNDSSAR